MDSIVIDTDVLSYLFKGRDELLRIEAIWNKERRSLEQFLV